MDSGLREISQSHRTMIALSYFYEEPKVVKLIETKGRLEFPGAGEGGWGLFNGCKVSSEHDEQSVQPCAHDQRNRTMHLKFWYGARPQAVEKKKKEEIPIRYQCDGFYLFIYLFKRTPKSSPIFSPVLSHYSE